MGCRYVTKVIPTTTKTFCLIEILGQVFLQPVLDMFLVTDILNNELLPVISLLMKDGVLTSFTLDSKQFSGVCSCQNIRYLTLSSNSLKLPAMVIFSNSYFLLRDSYLLPCTERENFKKRKTRKKRKKRKKRKQGNKKE